MQYPGKSVLFFLVFIVFVDPSLGSCEEPVRSAPARCTASRMARASGPEDNAGVVLASFFRDIISPVDGDRCPSLPSCSSYSVNAFKKHGFFTGWLMTVDRLLHEADEGNVSPRVYHNGRLRILDPVENNDYWWFCEDASTPD